MQPMAGPERSNSKGANRGRTRGAEASRALTLPVIGAAIGAYSWALRVLKSDSIQQEFLGEEEEATCTT
jgi:hypothetical protein